MAKKGWLASKDRSIEKRKIEHGRLETDISVYNDRIKNANEQKKRWAEARHKMDMLNLKRREQEATKEVWE